MNNFSEKDIEKYLLGQADPELLKAIDMAYLNDATFKEWIDAERDILFAINLHGEHSLRKTIEQVDESLDQDGFFIDPDIREAIELSGEKELRETIRQTMGEEEAGRQGRVIPLGVKRVLAVAASLLILVAAAWWYFEQNEGSRDLFADHFIIYHDNLEDQIRLELSESGFGGDETDILKKLNEGLQQYENREYESAFKTLYQLDQVHPDHRFLAESKFYQAMSLMNAGRYEEAVTWLGNYYEIFPESKKRAANWYMGMGYLAIGRQDMARKRLQKVTQDEFYGKAAQEILESLAY